MSADALTTNSRAFYERSKAKIVVSIVLGNKIHIFHIFIIYRLARKLLFESPEFKLNL